MELASLYTAWREEVVAAAAAARANAAEGSEGSDAQRVARGRTARQEDDEEEESESSSQETLFLAPSSQQMHSTLHSYERITSPPSSGSLRGAAAASSPASSPQLSRRNSQQRRLRQQRKKLVLMTFSVVKINKRGRKQKRVLRFTEEGVENIRTKSNVVSSFHRYSEIRRVVSHDISTFSIDYSTDHSYKYRSWVALQIVQELWSRTQLVRKIEKRAKFSDVLFQKSLTPTDNGRVDGDRLRASTAMRAQRSLAAFQQRASQSEETLSRTSKMDALLGLSEDERLTSVAWRLLHDPSSQECATLKHFVESGHGAGELLARNVRQFIDGLRFHIYETRMDEFTRVMMPATTAEERMRRDEVVNAALESSLEYLICPTFMDALRKSYVANRKERDASFRQKLKRLRHVSALDMGVDQRYATGVDYSLAALELGEIEQAQLPQDILDTIVAAVKQIYLAVQDVTSGQVVAADDFLPIFIFVVTRTRLQAPNALVALVWEVGDPKKLFSEGGYYLTMFEAALEWINEWNP